jgi:hypothetical protein
VILHMSIELYWNLMKGKTYILVWGYMLELICIVTYTILKFFIVIDDRLMISDAL